MEDARRKGIEQRVEPRVLEVPHEALARSSEFFPPSCLMVCARLGHQFVELASLGIARDLFVEPTLLELLEQLAEFGEIFGREPLDRLLNVFDLLQRSTEPRLSRPFSRSQARPRFRSNA